MSSQSAAAAAANKGTPDVDVNGADAAAKIINGEETNNLGGGAINEKVRLYNATISNLDGTDGSADYLISGTDGWDPRHHLSHMLHALVGLDRYPNYLSRFRELSDVDVLEDALVQRLEQVRQQKLGIIERRRGIRELVRRYNKLKDYATPDGDQDDCSQLWHFHLRPPTTWAELREKRVLNENAFNVAYVSLKTTKQKEQRSVEIGDIIDGKVHVDLDPALLEGWMDQEMFDVYSFPLLTTEVSEPR